MAQRRYRGEGNIRLRKDGRYEARITVGYSAEKKRIVKSVYGRTPAEVQEKLVELKENATRLDWQVEHQYTFEQWMNIWLSDYVQPRLKPVTVEGYRNIISRTALPMLGERKLTRIRGSQIQKIYNQLKTRGLSTGTIRTTHAVLHACFAQAVAERLIASNPATNCKIPSKEQQERPALTTKQVTRFLREAEKLRCLPLFYLELCSGLRRGEMLGLQWSDLDAESRMLHIRRSVIYIGSEAVVDTPKTIAGVRTIALPQKAVDLLQGIQPKGSNPDSWIFLEPGTDHPMKPRTLYKYHHSIRKAAGLGSIRFHDLRHTFSTIAIQQGIDPKTVSAMLGHTSSAFTLDTYTHSDMAKQREAADILEKCLPGYNDAAHK